MIKTKKTIMILTFIILVNSLFSIQPNYSLAKKSDESWVEIATSEDLKDIKEDLDANYLIIEDIDLQDANWTPLDKGKFTGKIESKGHIIKNMPFKYSEHKYFGLFEEVEDLDAIQVNVKFAEEREEAETGIDVKEKSSETEKTAELKEETLEKPAEEKAEEAELEDKEQLKKTQSKTKTQAQVAGEVVEVSNHSQFKTALENKDVTEINLTGNISAKASSSNRIKIAPREVVINGNGYKIQQTGGNSYSMMQVNPGTVNNEANIIFKNVDMVSTSGNSLLTDTATAVDWQITFQQVNSNDFMPSDGRLVHAKNAHVIFKNGVNFITTNKDIIVGAKSVTVESDAEVNMLSQTGRFYETSMANAELLIKKDGKLSLEGFRGQQSLIELTGSNSKLSVVGGTLDIISDRVYKDISNSSNQITSGLIKFTGNNAEFNANSGGKINVEHTQGSVLFMDSTDGQVNVNDPNTKVLFTVNGLGDDSNHDAPIHFNSADGYELNLNDGAYLEVEKNSGAAMGIRVGIGERHKVTVTGGSRFKIHNKGNGTAQDPAGERARNQALYYNGTLPEFTTSGKGSEVELIADNGVAMHMTGGGIINIEDGTTIIARGKTQRADRGIIDTGGVDDKAKSVINLTKPAFYDFRNDNTEGYIFHVGNLANIYGSKTDIALWPRGKNVNLNGPHKFRFLDVYFFKYMDENFKTLSTAATTSSGLKEVAKSYRYGLQEFSRISGNNAQAVVDDLYIPTNADRKIYAHVTIDEGIFGSRNAYTDEAEVEIFHEKANGGSTYYKGKTIGQDQFPNKELYEIYGKPVDSKVGSFGWVEIELPNNAYLSVGDELKVEGARVFDSDLESGNKTESDPENLFSKTRTVVDVVPPKPTNIIDPELTDYSRALEGTLTEDDANVTVEINGADANGDIEYNRENGTFKYTFSERLKIDDTVQIFLSNNAGPAAGLGPEASRPDRPETNKDYGNINPRETFKYHDMNFIQAPIIAVVKEPGELVFVSAPESLNFQVKVSSYAKEYLVDMNDLGSDLKIRDTRPSKSKWELSAKMSKHLTATDDPSLQLKDALIYRGEHGKTIINKEDSIIESHKYETSEDADQEWNLSSDPDTGWGQNNNGLFINIEPGIIKKDYIGEVTWTLSDAP